MAQDSIPVEADAVWDEDPTRVRRNAVRDMLGEQRELLDKQPKMWAKRNSVRTPVGKIVMRDKLNRSGFDDRLAFMGPFLGYWIQNRKIWKGKNQVVRLGDIPEVAFDKKGEKVELRKLVAKALAVFDADILASDRLRCKVCVEFRAQNDIELMAHFSKRHPEELAQLTEGIEKMRAEEEAQEEELPAAPPPRPRQSYTGKHGA